MGQMTEEEAFKVFADDLAMTYGRLEIRQQRAIGAVVEAVRTESAAVMREKDAEIARLRQERDELAGRYGAAKDWYQNVIRYRDGMVTALADALEPLVHKRRDKGLHWTTDVTDAQMDACEAALRIAGRHP